MGAAVRWLTHTGSSCAALRAEIKQPQAGLRLTTSTINNHQSTIINQQSTIINQNQPHLIFLLSTLLHLKADRLEAYPTLRKQTATIDMQKKHRQIAGVFLVWYELCDDPNGSTTRPI